ncbi:unannotated protein [freshwater metagenome]|uniref:Unannotated protein n=1 Tax=freshwater metagenome TaxID=449393 RepID=A0A6J7ENM4_9ZZZZ
MGAYRREMDLPSKRVADIVDTLIELPVITSYTRLGPAVRRRLDHWVPLASYDLTGRVIVLTGATSGLGLAAAREFAGRGASLVVVGRDRDKTQRVRDELAAGSGNDNVDLALADMGNLAQVRALGADLLSRFARIDVLIHNAGALSDTYSLSPEGIETTVASQVVGPFVLTTLLLDRLAGSAPSRVITMASGGMYSQPLCVSNLEMGEPEYKGATAYARAKRAQVTLNEMWALRHAGGGVRFHAMHPGWADTPGVQESLPTFQRVMGPLLRTPLEGADTLVWLAADDGLPLSTNGAFWLDRRRRSLHLLPSTRRSDTPEQRSRLWDHVAELAAR